MKRCNILLIFLLILSSNIFSVSVLNGQQDTNIPESNLIPVTYYSQITNYYCGPACVQMALDYLLEPDDPPSQSIIAEELKTDDVKKVTWTYNMGRSFYIRDFDKVREEKPLNIEKLKQYNSKGFLTILFIYYDNKKTYQHFVLVTGYNSTGIFVNDPWPIGWGDQEYRKSGPNAYISNEMLMDLWKNDWPYWGLVIPYKASSTPEIVPTEYTCEVSILGIPTDTSVDLYVNNEKIDEIEGPFTKFLDFATGTNNIISVDQNVTGIWNDAQRTIYLCENYSRTISSVGDPVSVEFSYDTLNLYFLNVNSSLGTTQGSNWYSEGEIAEFSVHSPIQVSGFLGTFGAKHYFSNWTGDSSSNLKTSTISMNSPKTVYAVWSTDYTQAYFTIGLIVIIAICLAAIALFVLKRTRR